MAWLSARYPGQCKECRERIEEGDRAVYTDGKMYCAECGIEFDGPDPEG